MKWSDSKPYQKKTTQDIVIYCIYLFMYSYALEH